MKISNKQKLEIGAYIVILALAIPCYIVAINIENNESLKNFLINISATFAGTGLLFFLLNRFFGITGNYNEPSANDFFQKKFPNFGDRIESAKSINIIGITLGRTSNTFVPDFQNCIDRGGKIKILVVNPNHKAMEVAANRFLKHQEYEKFKKECEHALDNFEVLKNRNNGNVEIRYLNAVPPFSLWTFDENSSRAELWLEIYTFRNNIEPAIHLTPSRDKEWYRVFNEQFELMWNTGIKHNQNP